MYITKKILSPQTIRHIMFVNRIETVNHKNFVNEIKQLIKVKILRFKNRIHKNKKQKNRWT